MREFRDFFLRRTEWGSCFFDESDASYKYYDTISPAIAARMRKNSDLATAIRSVLVEPLVIALRLFLALPDADKPKDAKEFAQYALREHADWIARLPLATAAPDDPERLARELVIAFDLFPQHELRDAGDRGAAIVGPLSYHHAGRMAPAAQRELRIRGLNDADIAALVIDGGDGPPENWASEDETTRPGKLEQGEPG